MNQMLDSTNVAMLQALAEHYAAAVTLEAALVVQFDLAPEEDVWHVVLAEGQSPTVQAGPHADARFVIVLSAETLARLYTGDLAPLTAAGRAHITDPAPLDFRLGAGVTLTPAVYAELIAFVQRFFNASEPRRILLGAEHARVVHGGHAVVMFYDPGFRSAWYLLHQGERLNAPGDTNPYPQAFVFLSGEGRAKIGDHEITVRANEAYHIPPHTEHIVWNDREEPLTLLFMAWGAGA